MESVQPVGGQPSQAQQLQHDRDAGALHLHGPHIHPRCQGSGLVRLFSNRCILSRLFNYYLFIEI